MEISQGNSLCSHLYLKQAKMSCFSFYLFSFFFFKIREQEGRIGPAQRGRAGTSRKKEVARKRVRRVNTVQKMCTLVCKYKNDTYCNYSMNWGQGDT
jgi:hypothetical protein